MSILRTLLGELKRRRVFRVAAAYAVVAWLVIQVASDTFPALRLPEWAVTLVVVCALLGFPVALALAWAFDLTPEGVRRDVAVPTATPDPAQRRPPRRALAYAGAGVGVVTLLAAYSFLVRGGDDPAPAGTAALASIAVLPFADLSSAGDQEYFAHGLAEELLNVLAQTEGLRVAARTSSFAFAGKDTPMTEIGRQLGVEHALEGSVRAADGQIRVTAQLIDARTGYHVWSQVYERDLADVFAIQDEISAAIANALELRLIGGDGAAPRGARSRDPEAYQLYLRGRNAWNQRTRDGLTESVRHFERAREIDPTFALAYAGLADAYMLLDDFRVLPREEAFAKGTAAARRALELDETLAEAHTSLAHILMHQFEREASEREYLRALELNPNLATAHQWYSLLLTQMRRFDDALAHALRAAELDPLSFAPVRAPAIVLYFARRPAEAAVYVEAALERFPGNEDLRYWLGWAYLGAGRHDEAAAVWRDMGSLPIAYAAGGRAAEARRELAELERNHGDAPPWRYIHIGLAYAHLGELDRAFEWLDRAADAHGSHLDLIEVDPTFDPLRADPRFQAMLRKTGHAR